MARGINKVVLVGNLGNDAEVRYGQNGNPVTTVSVATSERWKDKDGNPQERTEWHRVKFFGKLAEIAGEYLKKGRQVYIEGSLRTEKYQDKETGQDRYSTDIIASEMLLLGGNPNAREGGGEAGGEQRPAPAASRRPPVAGPAAAKPSDNDRFPDDDIPF